MRKKRPDAPTWVRKVCKIRGNHMSYRYCGCGQTILEQADKIVEAYDIPLLHGEDELTIAVICGTPLTSIVANSFGMVEVHASARLDPAEYFLQAHRCSRQPIGTGVLPIPRKPAGSTWRKPTLTDSELAEFKRAWEAPKEVIK